MGKDKLKKLDVYRYPYNFKGLYKFFKDGHEKIEWKLRYFGKPYILPLNKKV